MFIMINNILQRTNMQTDNWFNDECYLSNQKYLELLAKVIIYLLMSEYNIFEGL